MKIAWKPFFQNGLCSNFDCSFGKKNHDAKWNTTAKENSFELTRWKFGMSELEIVSQWEMNEGGRQFYRFKTWKLEILETEDGNFMVIRSVK